MARISEQQYIDSAEALLTAGLTDQLTELHDLYVAQQPVDYEFSETASNFLPSLGRAFGDIYSAVTSPIDTIANLGELVDSGVANLGQEIQDVVDPNAPEIQGQEMGEAMLGMLKDRYGSVDAVKNTAMNDPAGMLLDASAILTGGGGLAAKAPGIVGKTGEKISKVGQAIDPITGTVKAPVALVEGVTGQPISRMLYQSGMKPSTTIPPKKRAELLDQGLELGASPTERSINRLNNKKQELFDEVAILEDQSSVANVVEPQGLFKHIDEVKADYAPPVINTSAALKAIDDVVDQMQEAIELNGGNKLTVKELGRIKRNIYKQLNYDKKTGSIDLPSEKAMKAIARAAKEQIENVVPAVKKKNQLAGQITEVQNKIQLPASGRIGNRDLIGIGAPIKVGAGQAAGGDVGGILATLMSLADAPVAKTKLAIGANRAGKVVRNPKTAPTATGTALSGRLTEAMEKEERKRLYNQ